MLVRDNTEWRSAARETARLRRRWRWRRSRPLTLTTEAERFRDESRRRAAQESLRLMGGRIF